METGIPRNPLDRLGRSADRPSVAAGLVAATAAVFSAAWFVAVGAEGPIVGALYAATVANAAVVTYAVWWVLIPEKAWSYRRGLATGFAVGLASHLTIGYVWALIRVAVDPGRLTGPPGGGGGAMVQWVGEALLAGLFVSVFSVPFTVGIPIALSVAVALGLTYSRRHVTAIPGE